MSTSCSTSAVGLGRLVPMLYAGERLCLEAVWHPDVRFILREILSIAGDDQGAFVSGRRPGQTPHIPWHSPAIGSSGSGASASKAISASGWHDRCRYSG